jgi:serine/threonine protein kinase
LHTQPKRSQSGRFATTSHAPTARPTPPRRASRAPRIPPPPPPSSACPQSLSKPAGNLVKQLLTSDDSQRIGISAVKTHPFFAHIDWEHLLEVEPTVKPALGHPPDVQPRWSGAALDPGSDWDGEDDEDEGFDATFESKNVRKLALMHLEDRSSTDGTIQSST